MEVVRSGLIVLGLLGATILFYAVGAWVIGTIILVIAVLGIFSGAILHPRQLKAAMRPTAVSYASATPVSRGKQSWLMLDDKSGRELSVELRSRRLARSIGNQSVPVTVAGPLEPRSWVVVQTISMTIWPASKVSEGMPSGARHETKEPRGWRRDLMN